MQSITDQQHGFARNEVELNSLNDAVANFAQASAAYRSYFTQFKDTNAYLQQHVANMSSNNDELQQKPSALQNQMNMKNLVQNPAIPPGQTQRPHKTGNPPQYPHYPQPHHKCINLHQYSIHFRHRFHTKNPMFNEVVVEGEVVDVICQGGWAKGNINNRDNMEDRPNNIMVVVYNFIKHHHSSMDKIVITKDSRAHPKM